jgi:hypothetical protein
MVEGAAVVEARGRFVTTGGGSRLIPDLRFEVGVIYLGVDTLEINYRKSTGRLRQ